MLSRDAQWDSSFTGVSFLGQRGANAEDEDIAASLLTIMLPNLGCV
jgi:hypothetical protein